MPCSVIRPKRRRDVRRGCAVLAAGAVIAAGVVAFPGVALAAESVSAHVVTAHPTVGQPLEIDGQVSGGSSSTSTITVTRDDSTGQNQSVGMPVMTNPDGTFSVQDTPPARGSVTYHVSADGGAATVDVPTTVAGKTADLTITVTPARAEAESSVHVVAHLASATSNRTVTLFLRPYNGSRTQLDSGAVDANGDLAADHAVHRRTTFIADFAGDSAYAPAHATTTVRVRPVLDQALKGWYRSSGATKLYRSKSNPSLAVHMLPEHKGNCLYFRAQHRSHGKWVRSAVSGCVKTDGTGRAIGVLTGDHIVGVPYRLRAEWHGTKALARRNGAWLNLEFR